MRSIPAFLLCSLLCVRSFAQTTTARTTISDAPLSNRLVSYTIDARLDPDQRTVDGSMTLTWRNPDRVPVSELRFHLYLNAFRDAESTFMKESGGVHRGNSADVDDPWGQVEFEHIRIADSGEGVPYASTVPEGAAELTEAIRFIHPDDGNENDRTVIAVDLPEPVASGGTIALDIGFHSKLPEIVARTGWKMAQSGNPFFMVAQWFPKIAVLEIPGQRYIPDDAPHGEWNAHQFHSNSEFYADFGSWDVTLHVPSGYVVGATGVRVEESRDGDETTFHYLADDVHDFAWTASPDYLVFEDTWEHVHIRLLLLPWHKGQAERHLEAAKAALGRYAEWVGEYPYTTLTVVDGIGGSNGMEYPTLITAGTTFGIPEGIRLPELVIIHEFGHQYFYGMLASNEFEEAWLDEGMNSYMETRIVDDAYGGAAEVGPLRIKDRDAQRVSYTANAPSRGALVTNSWEYRFGDYAKASYAKPATVMTTLERYLGPETMQEFLHTYYSRWRFRHPSTRDLQKTVEDVSGQDLGWFFDQFVYGTAVVDYALERITVDSEGGGTVRAHRKYDGMFPQLLRVRFEDGSTAERSWDGQAQWIDLKFESESPIEEAWLDPEFVVFLDVDRLNNRMLANGHQNNDLSNRAGLRSSVLVQKLFIILSGLL